MSGNTEKSINMYEITIKEQEWIDRMSDPVVAKHCVKFGAAINRLDFSLIESLFTGETTYSSQTIFDTLKGRRTSDYWQQNIGRFRELGTNYKTFAELAQEPLRHRPCLLLIGRQGGYSTRGMGRAGAYIDIEATADDKIASLFSVNLVPSPHACRRSGLFPGLDTEEIAEAESYRGRSLPLSDNVTVYLFVSPGIELSMAMKDTFLKVMTDFKPAKHELVSDSLDDRDETISELCIQYGVHGYPCIIVTHNGKLAKKFVGYRGASAMRKVFEELFVR